MPPDAKDLQKKQGTSHASDVESSQLLIPAEYGGGYYEEDAYDCYGNFAGKDVYDLVASWKRRPHMPDRSVGIRLYVVIEYLR